MSQFLYALRSVVWSAVLAVVCSAASVLFAILWPASIGLPIAFGAAAITSAILAQRA